MNYEVVITDISTPLEKGVLTSKGRITEMCPDGVSVTINDIKWHINDVQPIKIELKELPYLKEPDSFDFVAYGRFGQRQYETKKAEYKEHVAALKSFICYKDLADLIFEKRLTKFDVIYSDGFDVVYQATLNGVMYPEKNKTFARIESASLFLYPPDLTQWGSNPAQLDDMNETERNTWIAGAEWQRRQAVDVSEVNAEWVKKSSETKKSDGDFLNYIKQNYLLIKK